MKISSMPLFGLLILCTFAAGCVVGPKDQYYWGNYEALVLAMYAEPGSADPKMQIEKLTSDLQQAENSGKPVPPGLYAHLGFMYAMNGNVSQAEAALIEETKRFPESTVLIEGMLARVKKNQGVSDAAVE